MLNKYLLADKYNIFVNKDNKEKFISEVSDIRHNLSLSSLKETPLLIYSKNKRNALYYTLGLHYSLKKQRILDFAVITGQSLINQHFLTEANRDNKLYTAINYADITFISLSQYDYSSEYLESLIIDLVEFRKNNNTLTVISYDILNLSKNAYVSLTNKLHSYFLTNDYQIVELVGNKQSSPFDTTQAKAQPKSSAKSKGGRIV